MFLNRIILNGTLGNNKMNLHMYKMNYGLVLWPLF